MPDGDQLYNGVRQLVAEHLEELAATLIVPAFPRSGGTSGLGKAGGGAEAVERALEGDRFLKSLKGVWEDHTGSMRKIKDVLKYMVSHAVYHLDSTGDNIDFQDKVYTQAHSVPKIYDVGLHLFLSTIIRSPKYPIHTHLIGSLLSQVQLERDGETVTRTTVRDCIDILLRLTDAVLGGRSVYATDFEPEFLRRSGEFYENEAGEVLERGDAALYLRNVSILLLKSNFQLCGWRDHAETIGREASSGRDRPDCTLSLYRYSKTPPLPRRRQASYTASERHPADVRHGTPADGRSRSIR